MKQNFLDAAWQCIQAASDGDADATADLPLFMPSLEEGALECNLTAVYYAAHLYDLGLGVEQNQARAFALLTWVNRHPGPQPNHRFGIIVKDWFACWDREIVGVERERALQVLDQFDRTRDATPSARSPP